MGILTQMAWARTLPRLSWFKEAARQYSSSARDTHFYTAHKEWCSVVQQEAENVTVTLGISDEGLDEFGEPGTVVCAAQLGEELKKGDKLLDIHWEGYQRTASDELYHAVWDVVSGTRTLTLPFAARVLEYNSEIIKEPGTLLSADSERENWLVKLEVPRASASLLERELLSRSAYLELLDGGHFD